MDEQEFTKLYREFTEEVGVSKEMTECTLPVVRTHFYRG